MIEQKQDFTAETEQLFRVFTPSAYAEKKALDVLTKTLKAAPKDFLAHLVANPDQLRVINISTLSTYLRVIQHSIRKQAELHFLFSQLVVLLASKYLTATYQHFNKNHKQTLQHFSSFLKNIQMSDLKPNSSNIEILLYLNSQKNLVKATQLVAQRIKNEVVVDKKNRQPNFIKAQKSLGLFIADNFGIFLPALERLLVRSETNLEIWKEVLDVVSADQAAGKLDAHVVQVLKHIKDLLIPQSVYTLDIVKSLTRGITSRDVLQQTVDIIENHISSNHDDRKRLVAIQMLEGAIESALKINDEEKTISRILVILIKLFFRLNQENFPIFSGLLNKALSYKTTGTKEILEACKAEVKGASKYSVLCICQVLSKLYTPEDLGKQRSLQQIVKEFEKVNKKSAEKIVLNLESYLGTLLLLTTLQTGIDTSSLYEDGAYLNQFNFLHVAGPVRDLSTRVFIKSLQQPDVEYPQDENPVAMTILIGLCGGKGFKINELLENTLPKYQLHLITEGIYRYYYFNVAQRIPLQRQSVRNLVTYIVDNIDTEVELGVREWHRLLSVSNYFGVVDRVLKRFGSRIQQLKEGMTEEFSHVLKQVLQKDYKQTNTARQEFHNGFLEICFKLKAYDIEETAQLLLNAQNYTNIKCLEEFEEQLKEAKETQAQNHESELDLLYKTELIKEDNKEKLKKAKIEAYNAKDIRIMDEHEVKIQRLRNHLLNMADYFGSFAQVMSLADQATESEFCDTHFQQTLSCMKYPELRHYLYQYVRLIFLRKPKFFKYSSFLAELFVGVGSEQIPRDRILEKFYGFESDLLGFVFSELPLHVINMFELVNSFLLSNLEFDVNLKIYAVKFYLKLTEDERCRPILKKIYPYVINNINLLSSHQETRDLLDRLMKVIDASEYYRILDDLLNYLTSSKRAVLSSIALVANPDFKISFEDYVKLRILSAESDTQISGNANKILELYKLEMDVDQINKFDMKRFVERHSKDTTDKLSQFAKESFTTHPSITSALFNKAFKTAQQLYEEGFDQEGLEFFPLFLTINMEFIKPQFFDSIYKTLITQYTADESLVTLNKASLQCGIDIIKRYGPQHSEVLLKVLESYLKQNKGVANVVYLGVLAPYLKDNRNLEMIEKRITGLFESDNENQQRAISKCMVELMSFFKQPKELVKSLYAKLSTLDGHLQVGQSYLIAGLLSGIGAEEMNKYLNTLLESYQNSKSVTDKKARLHIINALLNNFGRVLEPKIIPIMKVIIFYMSDNNEIVRDLSRKVAQSIMNRLSAFGVKKLLPELLAGLEKEENWRGKVTYIWALGNMAHCAPRQLQACLPKIVPKLSACLSDTHPKIRENATEALKVIGETIKNPQIFDSIDILISALSDPFTNSKRALQVLLKTKFSHFIDPPALSVIVPIINYALRGRDSELKLYACQVMGSICILIQNPDDLLPYIDFLKQGLRVTACDPLAEIRNVATKSLGKISSKIGIVNTEKYLSFVTEILQSESANSIERQGAAQGLSEIICSHGFEYFEESLTKIYKSLRAAKQCQKEGYISIFIFVPEIMKSDFEPFINELTENMTVFVSDQEEAIRNSSLQVQKILIHNFGLTHTEVLLEPLCDSLFEESWRKRNGALILIGEMLNVLKNFLYENSSEEKEAHYYQALMGVYILKDDEVEMPRVTAGQVWNAYIDNTPKTLKLGMSKLVAMWVKGIKQTACEVAHRNITAFASKYGESYFTEILTDFETLLSAEDPSLKSGVYDVFCEFLKRLTQQFLTKLNDNLRSIFEYGFYSPIEEVRHSLVRALAIYVEKMHETSYLEEKLYPRLEKVEQMKEESEDFANLLHFFGDLCSTSSKHIVESLVKKLMEKPLTEFKIEVLTNNAAKLANSLYSYFEKRPAIEIIKEEIVQEIEAQKSDDTRLKSLVYCYNELSINLSSKHREKLVENLSSEISNYSRLNKDELVGIKYKLLETDLQLLVFFLNNTPAEETGNLEELIKEITPLAFMDKPALMEQVNQILPTLFASPDKSLKTNYFKQFGVCLENNIAENSSDSIVPIWRASENAKLYSSIFINTLVYGGIELFDEALSVLNLFMKYTPMDNIQENVQSIAGAILRISNYRLSQKQRVRIQEFIQDLYGGKFAIQNFQFQVLSTIVKFAEVSKEIEHIELASSNLLLLLQSSNRRNELLLEFVCRTRRSISNVNSLPLCLYHIFKKVVAHAELIQQSTYEKVQSELSALLSDPKELSSSTASSVRNIYYISKTSARIAALALKTPFNKYADIMRSPAPTYSQLLQYLHFSYYANQTPIEHEKISTFLKESSQEKVLKLLKSLKLINKKNPEFRSLYSTEKVQKIISENIKGFEDIDDMLKSL